MTSSVYIHIPFCKSICSYCDFCKCFYNEKIADSCLESLEKEINDNYNGEIIKTLYIGGGTPSSLSIEQLNKLLLRHLSISFPVLFLHKNKSFR